MPFNSFENYFLSWKPERARLARPLYLSLAACLEEDIAGGILAPGARLPPQRELADYLGVNFTTVTRAYNLCREKNLIYGVTGSGSFVTPRSAVYPMDSPRARDAIELGVVKGFDEENTLVLEAAKNVLEKGYSTYLQSSGDPAGFLHQRTAGSLWMKRLGVQTDSAHTAIFSGAQNAISAALASLFRIGDRIAVDEFTYSNFLSAAKLFHIRIVPIPGDADGMLPGALDALCEEKNIAGLFLMPSCANPTAIAMSETRKDAVCEIAARRKLIVLEDDFLGAINPNAGTPLFARLPERTVYICGSTKSLCSGLRVAFAAYPERFRVKLLNGLFNLNIKTSSLDAEIVSEMIQSGKASSILERKQRLALRANRIFDRIFPASACDEAPKESFFRCLPVDVQHNGLAMEEELDRLGVRVCHSVRFAAQKKPERSFLRISVSSAGSPEKLQCGLKIVRTHLEFCEKRIKSTSDLNPPKTTTMAYIDFSAP